MGRRIMFLLAIALLIFSFTGTAYAAVSDATPSQTSAATSLTVIISCIFVVVCVTLAMRRSSAELKHAWPIFFAIAAAAVIVRVLIAGVYPGYAIDMSCFRSWAYAVHAHGPAGFYGSLNFADYPPGYMYILWFVDFLRNLFGFDPYSAANTVLLKLPAIISEVVIAGLVYKIASKESGKAFGIVCSCLILFNPALFFNSSVWGQIDPVFAMFIAFSLYYLKKENYLMGALFFAVSLLVKPQAIMFAPVIGLAFLFSLFKRGGIKRALIGIFGGTVIIAGVLFLGTLPFTSFQPQTSYATQNQGDEFIVSFGKAEDVEFINSYDVKYIRYYASGEGSFSLTYGDYSGGGSDVLIKPSGSDDEVPLTLQQNAASPEWESVTPVEFNAAYIDIHVGTPGMNIYEIGFYDGKGQAVPVKSVTPVLPGNGIPGNMFDEQKQASVQSYNILYWILNKYTGTVGSYPYGTLNAFNLFALLGGNWTPDTTPLPVFDYQIWGMIFLVIICAVVAFMQWKTRERRPYFDISAFLIISLFMLMHMVHERYIVPACVLLVISYAYSKDLSTLVFAGLWSVSALFNQLVVLYADTSSAPEGPLMVLSAINIALYAVYAFITLKKLSSGKVIIKSPALHG